MDFIKMIGFKNYDTVIKKIDDELKIQKSVLKRFMLSEIKQAIRNRKALNSLLKN